MSNKKPTIRLLLERSIFKKGSSILLQTTTHYCDLMALSKAKIGEIRIKLDGQGVKDHTVDVEDLGNFLVNFQSLMGKFAQVVPTKEKGTKEVIKARSRLYLKAIGKGSVDLMLTGSPQMTLNERNHTAETFKEVLSTTELINKNPSKARQIITNRFKEPKKRLEVEQKLKSAFSDKNLQIGLLKEQGIVKEKDKFVFLNPRRVREIDEWLKQDYNQSTDTIKGVIERLKGDGDRRYFTVRTYDKKFAKCYYKPEMEGILKDYFKKPIEVSGIIDHKVKGITIEQIGNLQAWKETKFDHLGSIKFVKPLEFTLDSEVDSWFVESKDFDVRGCGKNYDTALNDLEESLNDAIFIYVKKGKPENMTKKAIELREKLIKLIK